MLAHLTVPGTPESLTAGRAAEVAYSDLIAE